VKVEVHADLQAFDEARWNGLLDRARLPSVFLTWQWQTEWSRAFAAERPKQILAATDAAGELAGLLPLYEETPGRWRILGGVDVSDYLDLIAPAGREEEVWAALLAHCAAVERSYQILTFDERMLSAEENELMSAALKLGDDGRRSLRGSPLEHYLDALAAVRRVTLEGLAARDDAWLERGVAVAPRLNAHFAWFHVSEDEINHRGQIRWLRARLPKRESAS